ncbi:hypothetical protein J4219_02170 [Candidatus Woesearchaeota archaeon]|nr:hypothetical protein [Candidatus Woesearchaeota archaeon]
MRKLVLIALIVFSIIPLVAADDACGPGRVYSRGVIGCVQEKCPPGTGRLYSEACSCWTSEWGGTPRVTCGDENGLVTHCLPEGEDCSKSTSNWNPITGECVAGYGLNADKSACVVGGSSSPPSSTQSSSSPPSSSGTTSSSGTGTTTSSSSSPAQTQTRQQECEARPNMQYVAGKCGCKDGFIQDLYRRGCQTEQQVENQCAWILDATWNPSTKKCVCEDPKKFASAFTGVCESPEEFGTQVCNDRYLGAVYVLSEKKCGCPSGKVPSDDRKSCVQGTDAIGQSCSAEKPCPSGYACKEGVCGCAEGYRASVDGTKCQTPEEYGDEACPQRFQGSVYDPANKKCKCPAGWKKSEDGKSCVEPTSVTISGTGGRSCESDKNCTASEKCDGGKCQVIECDCGEIKDHKCEKYACCSDDKCPDDEKCDSNVCVDVPCSKGKVRAHECVENACESNSDCSVTYHCENGECVQVPCECGEVKDHACVPHECCNDAQCTAEDTACDTNEHKCKPVEVCKRVLRSGDPAQKWDVVVVPDKYTAADKAKFETDVNTVYGTFINMEPFKSEKARINFYRIEKFSENLNCRYTKAPGDPDGQNLWRLLVCDTAKATSLASKCPYNNVLVLVNSASQYGGSGGSIAVSYNGGLATGVFVHELGHMMGLDDEYSYGSNTTTVHPRANCDESSTCQKWSGTQGLECVQKCSYENWYRSTTSGDIMKDNVNNMFFGTVSSNHLKTVLGAYQ